jgi:hypothetical protein
MAIPDSDQQQGTPPADAAPGAEQPMPPPPPPPMQAGQTFLEALSASEGRGLDRAAASGQGLAGPQAFPVSQTDVPPQSPPPAGVAFPQPEAAPQRAPGPSAQSFAPGQALASSGVRVEPTRAAAGSLAIDRPPEGEHREELTTIALRNSPPWLVSAVFHMAVMIILGLLLMPKIGRNQIELETVWAEELGEQLEIDTGLTGLDQDDTQEPVFVLDDTLPEVPDPFATPPQVQMVVPNARAATSDIPSNTPGFAFKGREEGWRQKLLGPYGGNKITEKAVVDGLEWLARQQHQDGSWSLKGPYTRGTTSGDNPVAATAMALLAFQGNGNTHEKGKFRKTVDEGWKWLIREQDSEGNFFHEGPYGHLFYTNAQCTIALCELYGMTGDEKLREPAERAVGYLLRGQGLSGGWKYSPGGRTDVSVTGWVVMALQSARMAGLEVPEENLRKVERYLDKVGKEGGSRYAYEPDKLPTPAMTAEALLCRQYLGWRRDDDRLIDGVEWITQPENLINYHSEPNVYYWYYAAQVCHHMGGEYWDRWNEVMRQEVPEQQVKRGPEAGSWDPAKPLPDVWGHFGGRLYVTCLSIYMLEVYYRYLPIYSNVYDTLSK